MKVEMIVNDYPKVIIQLDEKMAPISVKNFMQLVENKFYDGLIFHRVINGFMIQGGGYDQNKIHKEASPIKGEFLSNGVNNLIKHEPGVISMARTMIKDSASSQFFIMHKKASHLDGEYAAFGKVISGMETIDEIANTATDSQDCPLQTQIIKSIRIVND